MNKIFKIVNGRVVSELAKSTGKALLVSSVLVTSQTAFAEDSIYNINIINNLEQTGLQLGDNSRARGEGSIATGNGSIAIGKNAVATGGNETKKSIEAKLAANQSKLNEIAQKEKEISDLAKAINDLKTKEHDVIESGVRVEELKKAKEKAKEEWQRIKQEHTDLVNSSQAFFQEHQTKIDDLNSRLSGVSDLTHSNISSAEGLTAAANELKKKVEQGTSLNLSTGFYKTYVQNHYKALGDLRKVNGINNEYRYNRFDGGHNTSKDGVVVSPYSRFDYIGDYYRGIDYDGSFFRLNFVNRKFTKNGEDLGYISEKTDVLTKSEFEDYIENAEYSKGALADYFNKCNDMFLSDEVRHQINVVWDKKMDIWKKNAEIAYYQGEYERTGDISWLDKKQNALNEQSNLVSDFEASENPSHMRDEYHKQWVIDNITSVSDKNKITTEKLTQELQEALGINMDAIKEKEKEIADKEKEAEQAENNYESIEPSEKDTILAEEYERIKKELEEKGKQLKTASERLEYLKDHLTLNDLTNVGKDTIAFGTNTVASGNNAIAFGEGNIATKENATAIGQENLVDSQNSQAVGFGNNLLSTDASTSINQGVLGNTNSLYGNNNYVIGSSNTVGKQDKASSDVFILGSNIDASEVSDAIVLGNASQAVSGALSIGTSDNTRKIINVSNGSVKANSHEVITGGQLFDLQNKAKDINVDKWKEMLGVGDVDLSSYYNKTETDTKLKGYSKTDVTNIDVDKYKKKLGISDLAKIESLENYYNKTQTNDLLANKANVGGNNLTNINTW